VAYRVRSLPEGWRIYDVNIEGVSMVANYRAQFDPIAQKKDGAAALIAALEKNIADFNADKK
jgi:phospholipid transport system substrate-binding protein